MTDPAPEHAGSPPADLIAYVADMLSQLAEMAASIGDDDLVRAITSAADRAAALGGVERGG